MKMNDRITITEATDEYIEIKIYKNVDRSVVENDVSELLAVFGKKMERYEIFSSAGAVVEDFRKAISAVIWFK